MYTSELKLRMCALSFTFFVIFFLPMFRVFFSSICPCFYLYLVSPSVEEYRGTANLPAAQRHKNKHQSWSQICLDDSITCYANDGRIAVNTQLHATSGVYAAGSVARFPDNAVSGSAKVAGGGGGKMNSKMAGVFVADRMALDFLMKKHDDTNMSSSLSNLFASKQQQQQQQQQQELLPTTTTIATSNHSFSSDFIPMWRSDQSHYDSNNTSNNALGKIGVQALCVGNCNADSMATHGYWWTNRTRKKRRNSTRMNMNMIAHDGIRKRRTNNMNGSSRSVYGVGVVYYFDSVSGRLCGIMTWGLPNTNPNGELNDELVERMKLLLKTNGQAAAVMSDDGDSRNNDLTLSSHHLAHETKHLALLALALDQTTAEGKRNTQAVSIFHANGEVAKPLHMFVPSKVVNHANVKLGWLKRSNKRGAADPHNQAAGLFVQNKDAYTAINRPPSLVRIYPMHQYSAIGGFLSSLYGGGNDDNDDNDDTEDDDEMSTEEEDDHDHGRPLEEDPLWLRKKDASRGRTKVEMYSDAYRHNIGTAGGHYYDGRKAHKWL